MIFMLKAQADIVAAVIIVIIALSLTGLTYSILQPLIQKRQDTAILNRVFNSFSSETSSSLGKKIQSITYSKGDDTFVLDNEGHWRLYGYDAATIENNSIQFTFLSKVTGITADIGWVPLESTANCGVSNGLLGVDEPFVVCGRADKRPDGYNVTIKTWFRELDDSLTSPTLGSRIILSPKIAALNTSVGKGVKIFYGATTQQTVGSKNLIITEVKILLE